MIKPACQSLLPFQLNFLIFKRILIFALSPDVAGNVNKSEYPASRMMYRLADVPAAEFKQTVAIKLFRFRQNHETATTPWTSEQMQGCNKS